MKSTAGIFLVSILLLGACAQKQTPQPETAQPETAQPETAAHQESAENEENSAELRGSDDNNLTDQQITAGEEVYESNCAGCHDSGTGGAPRPGKPDDWKGIIDQSLETLTKRSIEGFAGKKGIMPAKGGNEALTDNEVTNAIRYMIFKTR
ncbi:MAG: cytochrome c5 family protein [Chlorobiaceae bacterium]|nr:cytochrome c5 family protein [Chlorobiaceae bacterium]